MTRDRAIEIFRDDASGASLFELAEAVDMAIEALKEQRPHGEWEVIGRETFSPTVTYRCSVCKAKEVSCVPNDKPHYCENCGARMTGEGDAE